MFDQIYYVLTTCVFARVLQLCNYLQMCTSIYSDSDSIDGLNRCLFTFASIYSDSDSIDGLNRCLFTFATLH